MSIFLFDEDIIEARTFCYDNESRQVGINVYHYVVDDVAGNPTMVNAVDAFAGAAAPVYTDWLSEETDYSGCTVRRIDPNPTPELKSQFGAAPGTQTGGQAPLNASAVISKYTDTPGPKGRGRVFVPFIPLALLSAGGSLTSGGIVRLDAIATALLLNPIAVGGGGDTANLRPIVTGRLLPGIYSLITSHKSQFKVATQRRRGDYGKMNQSPF